MYDHELEREILLAHTSSWCERESERERERERERGREFRVAKKKCRGNLGRPNPVGRSVGRFSSVAATGMPAVWAPLSVVRIDRYMPSVITISDFR